MERFTSDQTPLVESRVTTELGLVDEMGGHEVDPMRVLFLTGDGATAQAIADLNHVLELHGRVDTDHAGAVLGVHVSENDGNDLHAQARQDGLLVQGASPMDPRATIRSERKEDRIEYEYNLAHPEQSGESTGNLEALMTHGIPNVPADMQRWQQMSGDFPKHESKFPDSPTIIMFGRRESSQTATAAIGRTDPWSEKVAQSFIQPGRRIAVSRAGIVSSNQLIQRNLVSHAWDDNLNIVTSEANVLTPHGGLVATTTTLAYTSLPYSTSVNVCDRTDDQSCSVTRLSADGIYRRGGLPWYGMDHMAELLASDDRYDSGRLAISRHDYDLASGEYRQIIVNARPEPGDRWQVRANDAEVAQVSGDVEDKGLVAVMYRDPDAQFRVKMMVHDQKVEMKPMPMQQLELYSLNQELLTVEIELGPKGMTAQLLDRGMTYWWDPDTVSRFWGTLGDGKGIRVEGDLDLVDVDAVVFHPLLASTRAENIGLTTSVRVQQHGWIGEESDF